jgi:hypothetical protein
MIDAFTKKQNEHLMPGQIVYLDLTSHAREVTGIAGPQTVRVGVVAVEAAPEDLTVMVNLDA